MSHPHPTPEIAAALAPRGRVDRGALRRQRAAGLRLPRSIIDSFGILYHSQGTVRGADLTTRFRYRPSRLPNVFG